MCRPRSNELQVKNSEDKNVHRRTPTRPHRINIFGFYHGKETAKGDHGRQSSLQVGQSACNCSPPRMPGRALRRYGAFSVLNPRKRQEVCERQKVCARRNILFAPTRSLYARVRYFVTRDRSFTYCYIL